jgi:hypothetical protein
MDKGSQHVSPFVCDLSALDAEQRPRHQALGEELRSGVLEVQEVADGYAFRYASEPSVFLRLTEFVFLERICCPVCSGDLRSPKNQPRKSAE